MGVRETKQRSAGQGRARHGLAVALGTLWLVCALGACIRAPALIVGARSTLGMRDRRPRRVDLLCALEWSRPMRGADPRGTAESIEAPSEVELEESGAAVSGCDVATLCEWETRARHAALLRALAASPEAAP
jgi:hypothetical protein